MDSLLSCISVHGGMFWQLNMDLVELSVLLTLPRVSYLLSHQALPDLLKVSPRLMQKTAQKYRSSVAFWAGCFFKHLMPWTAQIIRSLCQCSGCALRLAAALEAAAGEIQVPFLSAQPGLAAKILGLFKRLMAKQKMGKAVEWLWIQGAPHPLLAPVPSREVLLLALYS